MPSIDTHIRHTFRLTGTQHIPQHIDGKADHKRLQFSLTIAETQLHFDFDTWDQLVEHVAALRAAVNQPVND